MITDTRDIYQTTIKDLPNGDYFILKPNSKVVYSKGDYDRSDRAYECTKFTDCSSAKYLKGSTVVYTGFTF